MLFKVVLLTGIPAVFFLLTRKFLTHKWDTATARRRIFPVGTKKRSHSSPQVNWHPRLKIQKQADGFVDGRNIENSLSVEHGYYTTLTGVKLFWQSHRPKRLEDVTHIVVNCHGYGDHCDYGVRQTALTLAALNSAWVFSYDMPGHGRSDGLWALIDDWRNMILQVAELVECCFLPKTDELQKPVFCWGESLGGAVAIHLCMCRPEIFKGVVLSSPMCGIADDIKPPELVVKALIFLSSFAGTLPITPAKDQSPLVWKDPNDYHSIVLGPQQNFLNYRMKARLATARELLRGSTEIIERASTEMKTPFLIIHGDSDYVCPIEMSRKFHRNALVEDKMLKEVSGGWHAVFTSDIEKIYQDAFDWINKRI